MTTVGRGSLYFHYIEFRSNLEIQVKKQVEAVIIKSKKINKS